MTNPIAGIGQMIEYQGGDMLGHKRGRVKERCGEGYRLEDGTLVPYKWWWRPAEDKPKPKNGRRRPQRKQSGQDDADRMRRAMVQFCEELGILTRKIERLNGTLEKLVNRLDGRLNG